MLTWELLGAVVGAGLASGQEIASFFSRYGAWSYAGILIAVLVMTLLNTTEIPSAWTSRWPAKLWQWMMSALLIAAGGAMLSCAGEVAALSIPWRGAYWAGMVFTMLMAWILARCTVGGLAWASRILLAVFAGMILLGLVMPTAPAALLQPEHVLDAIPRAIAYGGFNAALQVPIMLQANTKHKQRCAAMAGVLMYLLLIAGNAVLLRHPSLMSGSMPYIRMVVSWGKFGYILGLLCLYLAALSTLTACIRGLEGKLISTAAIICVALFGFTGAVETIYPILGGGCFVILVAAKFTNCARKPFLSSGDMV